LALPLRLLRLLSTAKFDQSAAARFFPAQPGADAVFYVHPEVGLEFSGEITVSIAGA
jgi:hypothetical protein